MKSLVVLAAGFEGAAEKEHVRKADQRLCGRAGDEPLELEVS